MFAKNLHSFRNALMQQDMRKNFFLLVYLKVLFTCLSCGPRLLLTSAKVSLSHITLCSQRTAHPGLVGSIYSV